MKNIEIVILANSIKHHQHCVAGKAFSNGKWIRPVSNVNGSELSHDQAKCKNPHGKFKVKPLQKVLMSFIEHAPLPHQPENFVIDGTEWKQNYKIADTELRNYLDNPDDLWGMSDRVCYADILSGDTVIGQSLYLVSVENLTLYINSYEKRRASFSYRGITYDFAVTDPNFDIITQYNNTCSRILCISLGEEYDDYCFKLVATIF